MISTARIIEVLADKFLTIDVHSILTVVLGTLTIVHFVFAIDF